LPNKLKDLKITSTDLCQQGANQDAKIRLFKRKDGEAGEPETLLQKAIDALTGIFGKTNNKPVQKEAETFADELRERKLREVCNQAWDFCYALDSSLCSIIYDDELSEEEKRDMLLKSLDEFVEVMRNAIPAWAAGNKKENAESAVQKSAAQTAAFEEIISQFVKAKAKKEEPDDDEDDDETEKGKKVYTTKKNSNQNEEVTDTMKIDKSKMTPEELAALEAIEKKYGIAEPDAPAGETPAEGDVAKKDAPPANPPTEGGDATPELHPEVKKALESNATLTAQIEALQKSLEIKDLTATAKKYEIIGKKADELAPKLYELKKAGGTHYDDTIALLDEQVNLVEKSGMFGELGTAQPGTIGTDGELGGKVSELRKSNPTMTEAEAIIKAFEENPELAAKYDNDYYKGRLN
jgi:hypothetical protein